MCLLLVSGIHESTERERDISCVIALLSVGCFYRQLIRTRNKNRYFKSREIIEASTSAILRCMRNYERETIKARGGDPCDTTRGPLGWAGGLQSRRPANRKNAMYIH